MKTTKQTLERREHARGRLTLKETTLISGLVFFIFLISISATLYAIPYIAQLFSQP